MTDRTAAGVRALAFDVFGTVVDWRSGVVRELLAFGAVRGVRADWPALADAWRGRYQPSLERVRSGARDWVSLDTLHRESLAELAASFGLRLADVDLDHLTGAWHRLDPWPDGLQGLGRLRRWFRLAALSNGNIRLIGDMASRAGLPWDVVAGAEPTRSYKPVPECYLGSARLLGLRPSEILMVAAHNDDLAAADALGFRTAFVPRPTEYGPGQRTDLAPSGDWDVVARDLVDLAGRLGC